MKLSELTGQPPKAGKIKLSSLKALSEPAAAATPEPAAPAQSSALSSSPYAKLVEGLPEETALKIIEENKATGRAADVRSRSAIEKAAKKAKLEIENPYLAETIDEMGVGERALVGMGEGFATIGRGLGLMDQKDETSKRADQALRDQSAAANVGKFAAMAAPAAIPGTAIARIGSTAGRAALSAGLGAAEGNVIARGEGGTGGEIAAATALGAGLGVAGEAILPVANKMVQVIAKRLGKTPDEIAKVGVKADGTPTPEYEAVLQESGVGADDLAKAAAGESTDHRLNALRQKAFDDLGLEYTEAERTRDMGLWVDQSSQVRDSGKVKDLVDRREAQLDKLTEQQIVATGGDAAAASPAVYDAIVNKSEALTNEITDLYRVARESAPDTKNIRFETAIESLKENAPSNDVTNGIVKALKQKMTSMGVMGKKWQPSGRIDLQQAEELRQYANRLSRTANGEGQFVIRQFKESLDDDVFKSVDSTNNLDLFKQARAAKAKYEGNLDTDKLNKFDKRKVSLVRDILDNKVSQDQLAETIVKRSGKYRAKDLNELKDYLTTGTAEQVEAGAKAWDNVRAATLTQIKDKAFTGPVTREGTQNLSRAAFDRAIASIGDEKMKVLFSPAERKFLKSLGAVATYKEAPAGAYSPSGPAINKAALQILERVPALGPFVNSVTGAIKSKAAERRLLNLVDDAKVIAKQNERLKLNKLRKSNIGVTIQAAPLAAIPAVASGDDE